MPDQDRSRAGHDHAAHHDPHPDTGHHRRLPQGRPVTEAAPAQEPEVWALAIAVPAVAAAVVALVLWSGVLGDSWRSVSSPAAPTGPTVVETPPGQGLGLRGAAISAPG